MAQERITFHDHKTQYDNYLVAYSKEVQQYPPTSIDNFYTDIQRSVSRTDSHYTDKMAQFQAEYTFYKNGQPTYKLFPAIANALVDTKIDIPSTELKLPFSSFIIKLPVGFTGVIPRPKVDPILSAFQLLGLEPETLHLCSILISRARTAPTAMRVLSIEYQVIGSRSGRAFRHFFLPLLPGKSINESISLLVDQTLLSKDAAKRSSGLPSKEIFQELQTISKLVTGTCFIAISKDKDYIKRERIKIRGNDLCFCGSGKKYKKCCKLKPVNQPIGFAVGRDIILYKEEKPGKSITVEGRGRELQYGHLRTGHMRWQWRNDETGKRIRKLIFIHPTIVKPDLPMKPRLTERTIRRRKPKKPRRKNPRLRVGDLVIVNRPKNLPARIGRITRLGKKVYVLSPGQRKAKRYSYTSVELAVRTGMKIESRRNPFRASSCSKCDSTQRRVHSRGLRRWRVNPWYDSLLLDDLYRGTAKGIMASFGVGVLGAGVYLSWDERVARGFANIYADRYDSEPLMSVYRIAPNLNILEKETEDWNQVMAGLGLEPWDKIGGQFFSNLLTSKLKELGYDGVISRDPQDGLVIFDGHNVIGYVDPTLCPDCDRRKLQCEKCGHFWCYMTCDSQYEDCPE